MALPLYTATIHLATTGYASYAGSRVWLFKSLPQQAPEE